MLSTNLRWLNHRAAFKSVELHHTKLITYKELKTRRMLKLKLEVVG